MSMPASAPRRRAQAPAWRCCKEHGAVTKEAWIKTSVDLAEQPASSEERLALEARVKQSRQTLAFLEECIWYVLVPTSKWDCFCCTAWRDQCSRGSLGWRGERDQELSCSHQHPPQQADSRRTLRRALPPCHQGPPGPAMLWGSHRPQSGRLLPPPQPRKCGRYPLGSNPRSSQHVGGCSQESKKSGCSPNPALHLDLPTSPPSTPTNPMTYIRCCKSLSWSCSMRVTPHSMGRSMGHPDHWQRIAMGGQARECTYQLGASQAGIAQPL